MQDAAITPSTAASAPLVGASFLDREGTRWWVRGPRPDAQGQLIVEAHLKGAYPRVGLYVMTEPELRQRVESQELKPFAARPGLHG